MKSPYYAQLAARILARVPEPRLVASEARRSAAVLQIEGALQKRATHRRRSRWAVGAGALLAAAAGVAFVMHGAAKGTPNPHLVTAIANPRGDGARILMAAGSEALQSGSTLLPGGQLLASSRGGASLRLSTGSEIAIEHDAKLLFSEAGPTERFVLSQGAVLARVAKLRPGERFLIATPDAEVEVHGTVFHLAVVPTDFDCPGRGLTRLEVSEGVVEVRANGRAAFVRPGEQWPAKCAATETALEPAPTPHASPDSARASAAPRSPRSIKVSAPSSGPLSEEALSLARAQNDLFSKAISARRRGDTASALATFQTLMTQYPGSALAENAAAERMRILAPSQRAAAGQAAREYLTRYPRGFAAAYASTLLTER